MKKWITMLTLVLSINYSASSYIRYDHVCTIGDSYGNRVEIYYDGNACGTSSNWKSYKLMNGLWVYHNSSATYGDLNLSDFSCCNPA